jgi:hypothetical protein
MRTKATLTVTLKCNSTTMPKHSRDDDKENRQSQDIRQFLSPAPRRRRVITSDSDEDEHIGGGGPAIQNPQSATPREDTIRNSSARPPAEEHSNGQVHHVSSDDDSMYVPGVRNPSRNAAAQQTGRVQQISSPQKSKRAATKTASPRATASLGPAKARGKRSRNSRFVGEADEDSSNDDVSDYSSDCIERDTNGADLYCQAVSSLRNANNARNQLRAATTNCRVCAKFALFLQHFL